jgi:hypothetical protein
MKPLKISSIFICLSLMQGVIPAYANLNDDFVAAVTGDRVNIVKKFLGKGVSINQIDPDTGYTPLMWAASAGSINVARLLLSKGANKTIKTKDGGQSALSIAIQQRNFDVAELIDLKYQQYYPNLNYGGTYQTGYPNMIDYMAVETGMDFLEVINHLGNHYEQSSMSEIGSLRTESYNWTNPNGGFVNVIFQHDKVVSKSQYGLKYR